MCKNYVECMHTVLGTYSKLCCSCMINACKHIMLFSCGAVNPCTLDKML